MLDGATPGPRGLGVVTLHVVAPMCTMAQVLETTTQLAGVATLWRVTGETPARPEFMAAARVGYPLDVEVETRSDGGLRSMRDEAQGCWTTALSFAEERAGWLDTLGVHPVVADRLLEPFTLHGAVVTIPNWPEELARVLVQEEMPPDTRLLGWRVAGTLLDGRAAMRHARAYAVEVEPPEGCVDDLRFHAHMWDRDGWVRRQVPHCGDQTLEQILDSRPGWATD